MRNMEKNGSQQLKTDIPQMILKITTRFISYKEWIPNTFYQVQFLLDLIIK